MSIDEDVSVLADRSMGYIRPTAVGTDLLLEFYESRVQIKGLVDIVDVTTPKIIEPKDNHLYNDSSVTCREINQFEAKKTYTDLIFNTG